MPFLFKITSCTGDNWHLNGVKSLRSITIKGSELRNYRVRLVFITISLIFASFACSGVPFLASTATPTTANTPTSSPTPTSTPVPPTNTPTATPTPLPNTLTEELPDGSFQFVDYEFGYAISFPEKWYLLDPNEGDMEVLISEAGKLFPEFARNFDSFSEAAVESMRLMALDVNSGHLVGGFTPNINIIYTDDPQVSGLTLDFILEATSQSLPDFFPGTIILGSELDTNSNGIELGRLNYSLGGMDPNLDIQLIQQQIFIKIGDGLAILTFTATDSNFDDMLPFFDLILDTLILLD